MSKLSDILKIDENRVFTYGLNGGKYKIDKNLCYYLDKSGAWKPLTGTGIYMMIENPDKIQALNYIICPYCGKSFVD